MPPDLLQSQFDALERPCADEHDIARIDVNHDIEHVIGCAPTGCTGFFVRHSPIIVKALSQAVEVALALHDSGALPSRNVLNSFVDW